MKTMETVVRERELKPQPRRVVPLCKVFFGEHHHISSLLCSVFGKFSFEIQSSLKVFEWYAIYIVFSKLYNLSSLLDNTHMYVFTILFLCRVVFNEYSITAFLSKKIYDTLYALQTQWHLSVRLRNGKTYLGDLLGSF